MKNKLFKAIALVCVLSLSTPLLSHATCIKGDITNTDVDNAKKEKEEQQKKVAEAKKKLESIQADKNDIIAYANELDAQISEIKVQVDDVETKKDAKQVEIDDNEQKLEKAKQDEADQYEAMKLRIQYMYETGQTTYLEALLSAKDISEILNNTEYVKSITEYDKKMMDKLVETKNLIAQTQEQLEKEYAELDDLEIELKAQEAALDYVYQQKQEQIKELEKKEAEAKKVEEQEASDLASMDASYNELVAKFNKQEAEKAAALAAAQSQSSGSTQSGSISKSFLQWPLSTSHKTITDKYGWRTHPVLGGTKFHYGIDISASRGTPVYAAADGVVLTATYNYSYGNYIILYHANGIATLYAHSDKLVVSANQEVKKGDVIMYVGSTGYSTGPHLHYEVWNNGTKVDPLQYYDTTGFTYRLD